MAAEPAPSRSVALQPHGPTSPAPGQRPEDPAPGRLAALLLQAAALERWAITHRRATLTEHEQGVLGIFRGVMGPALGAVLARALELDQPVARRVRAACGGCARKRKPHAWRRRDLLTVCGAATFERPYYYCGACKRGRARPTRRWGWRRTRR